MNLTAVSKQEAPSRPHGREPSESWEAYAVRCEAWRATAEGQAAKLAEDELAARRKASEEADRRQAWANRIGIPERYRFLGDEPPQETQAITAVREPTELLVLSGAAGCGKTAAACWWLLQPAPRGGAPLFLTAARLSRLSKFDDETMTRVLRASRLVIDDLAVEYADEKGFFRSLLDEVINERYGNRLATLITTNLDKDTFKDRCGERITDRVREAGRFMSLTNPSMRRRTP